MNADALISELDMAIKSRGISPKGIIINAAMFHALHARERLTRKAGFPDFGLDFWSLDREIFVAVDLLLDTAFRLPPAPSGCMK